MSSSSDSSSTEGSWGKWAKFIVNEVQRTSKGVMKLETNLTLVTQNISKLENEITKLAASNQNEIIHKEMETIQKELESINISIQKDINSLHTLIENTNNNILVINEKIIGIEKDDHGKDLTEIRLKINTLEGSNEESKKFETTIKTLFAASTCLLTTGLGIVTLIFTINSN